MKTAQYIPRGDRCSRLSRVHNQRCRAIGLVLGLHGLERERYLRAYLCAERNDVLTEFGIALLRHRRGADGTWRHRFLYLAEFGFHECIDFATNLAAGR